MGFHSKVLITGLNGFTGRHLGQYLTRAEFNVVGLESDLSNREAVLSEVMKIRPDYVIHLAAISFAAESNIGDIYSVNVVGSTNLLDALVPVRQHVKKLILASSATVYGNQSVPILSESLCPLPVNHYGCSKLSMEYIARNYFHHYPTVITRPFNYTGIGHAEHFLIPKIVNAYKTGVKEINLGNLDVYREFNDVRDICAIYHAILTGEMSSDIVNICSGKSISLMHIIELMNDIAGYEMKVKVNPNFVRDNEIKDLSGDTRKLHTFIQHDFEFSIQDTLHWMYEAKL